MKEMVINIEAVRIPPCRDAYGPLGDLSSDIKKNGLRHPIIVWKDGTLVSGARRLRAHFLLSPDDQRFLSIQAVFVDTIEDAAKHMLTEGQDEFLSVPMSPSSMCRWWDVLRQLDEPAAVKRAVESRKRGVELRRQTQAGTRVPGRSKGHRSEDYVLSVLCEPFGLSEPTACRLWAVYQLARVEGVAPERRAEAVKAMCDLDEGSATIWGAYANLIAGRSKPVRPKVAVATESAPAARQLAGWNRSLPQLEGLLAGLAELGPPNTAHDRADVESVRARLVTVRREMEKIIRQMKENDA